MGITGETGNGEGNAETPILKAHRTRHRNLLKKQKAGIELKDFEVAHLKRLKKILREYDEAKATVGG